MKDIVIRTRSNKMYYVLNSLKTDKEIPIKFKLSAYDKKILNNINAVIKDNKIIARNTLFKVYKN